MADFVAVIRRAVDGLSDNTPEMRLKVYDKARGAVRRQLEAMTPRPSDDLVNRQLDKLEAAIQSVEGDYAEALPSEDTVEETPAAVAEAPAEEATVEAVPEPEEPVAAEPEEPEPQPEEPPAEIAAAEEASPFAGHAEPEAAPAEEPASDTAPVWSEPVAAEQPVAGHHAEPEPAEDTYPAPQAHDEAVSAEPAAEDIPHETVEPVEQAEAGVAAETDTYVPSWEAPALEAEAEPTLVAEGYDEVHVEPEAAAQPFQEEPVFDTVPADEARMPEADTQWNWEEPVAVSVDAGQADAQQAAVAADAAWDWPEEKPAEKPAEKPENTGSSEWGDLEDLIGYSRKTEQAPSTDMEEAALADTAATSATPAAETTPARAAPQRSFRTEPRRSRRGLVAAGAILGVLVVVGAAGAAYWFNRDAVNTWASDLVASVTGPAAETGDPAPTPDTATGEESGERNLSASSSQTDGSSTPTEVAAVGTGQTDGKFTQRLLADGSEVDEGPAPSLDGSVSEEGKSVASQSEETIALATEGNAAATADGAPADAATTDTTTQTPATADQAPAGAQKMFLYEERLGQSSPTAIEGTVVWSAAEESPGGDARPEPVVRAQINVPSNGLTALITFRRNGDQSLPASHLVEIVFSLPASFEGGGIENVQRVALKRTEQDRGDALIAVPAKITDDFHMIALNDFPEAVAKNTELLRTRSWIDIPITYRNGRRALITLDKGVAGEAAFDSAMRSWATLGAANSQ